MLLLAPRAMHLIIISPKDRERTEELDTILIIVNKSAQQNICTRSRSKGIRFLFAKV